MRNLLRFFTSNNVRLTKEDIEDLESEALAWMCETTLQDTTGRPTQSFYAKALFLFAADKRKEWLRSKGKKITTQSILNKKGELLFDKADAVDKDRDILFELNCPNAEWIRRIVFNEEKVEHLSVPERKDWYRNRLPEIRSYLVTVYPEYATRCKKGFFR